MLLANAIRLLERHGATVVCKDTSLGIHEASVNGRIVRFYAGDPPDETPIGTIAVMRKGSDGSTKVDFHRNMTQALRAALHVSFWDAFQFDDRTIVVEVRINHAGKALKPWAAVFVDKIGRDDWDTDPMVQALAFSAVEMGSVGPLLDWIQEHYPEAV